MEQAPVPGFIYSSVHLRFALYCLNVLIMQQKPVPNQQCATKKFKKKSCHYFNFSHDGYVRPYLVG